MEKKYVHIHKVKRCKYCREWYSETIDQTKKIKDKAIRQRLLHLWDTLWLNNSTDFDIICYEFACFMNEPDINKFIPDVKSGYHKRRIKSKASNRE